MNNKLGTQPIKGFRDFVPSDWKVQQYIFDTWRKVCESYGYEEYNGPVLEYATIYEKSGDDLGTTGKELYKFTDQGGRELALRPEMTPTVGRMIAEYEKIYSKPIRWFSIAQFFRAEKPQKGRGREFFQLNVDIFGSESVYSDIEIISLAVDMMYMFGATDEMFDLRLNNRYFAYFYFKEVLGLESREDQSTLLKLIDRFPKKGKDWLGEEIRIAKLDVNFNDLEKYLNLNLENVLDFLKVSLNNDSLYIENKEDIELFYKMLSIINETKLKKVCIYDATIARGLDYYTGTVFEVFDRNPKNNRAILGGGRYDDLLSMYREKSIPAIGFGWGDMPTRVFLEGWNLLDNRLSKVQTYYFPIISTDNYVDMLDIAKDLRTDGHIVVMGTRERSVGDALRIANKKGYDFVVIYGEEEKNNHVFKLKNMKSGKENMVDIDG